MEDQYRTIREMLEEQEARELSPFAMLSRNSKGRDYPIDECDIRPDFQRDRDKILHCKAFRRLKHKTQVFLAPEGDHYRTRLTHTLEVAQISRTIAKALRLNESLTEAIALGHDLGHTPFGHSGEAVLNRLCSEGFDHCFQSVRVVELLENGGRGLNLTKEVRDGILNHRTSGSPSTLEGQIVRRADKIAYLNHDVDDAIRAGIIGEEDIPPECRRQLGQNVHDRLSTLIHDVIGNSLDRDSISMSTECEEAMKELRAFMFRRLYVGGAAKAEEKKAQAMLELLYRHYADHPEEMPTEYTELIRKGASVERAVADYISGMSDNYAVELCEKLFIPRSWHVL